MWRALLGVVGLLSGALGDRPGPRVGAPCGSLRAHDWCRRNPSAVHRLPVVGPGRVRGVWPGSRGADAALHRSPLTSRAQSSSAARRVGVQSGDWPQTTCISRTLGTVARPLCPREGAGHGGFSHSGHVKSFTDVDNPVDNDGRSAHTARLNRVAAGTRGAGCDRQDGLDSLGRGSIRAPSRSPSGRDAGSHHSHRPCGRASLTGVTWREEPCLEAAAVNNLTQSHPIVDEKERRWLTSPSRTASTK